MGEGRENEQTRETGTNRTKLYKGFSEREQPNGQQYALDNSIKAMFWNSHHLQLLSQDKSNLQQHGNNGRTHGDLGGLVMFCC